MFGRSAFVYQPEADTYMCPAGHVFARKQAKTSGLRGNSADAMADF